MRSAGLVPVVVLVACAPVASPMDPPRPRDGEIDVAGRAWHHVPWCNGVHPRPVDEARARDGVPLVEPLAVHAGDRFTCEGRVAQIAPRADGRFTLRLPAGRYCVVTGDHERPDAPIEPGGDGACLRTRRAACDATWIVPAPATSRGDAYDVVVHRTCGWNRPCFPSIPGPP